MIREFLGTAMRWLCGIGFFGLSLWIAIMGFEKEQYSLVFFAPVLFLLGLAAVWKPLFYLATRPFTLLVDSLFFPGGKLDKPVLNLKLPAFYINESRYDEALFEYQKILKHYPDEPEAYEKAIWLYAEIFDDSREAEKLLERARKRRIKLDPRFEKMIKDGR